MADIEIRRDELSSAKIDEIINLERSLRHSEGEFVENVRTPFYLNPLFYYALATFVGALVVWAIEEPFYDDTPGGIPFVSDFILFGPVAGVIGLALGVVYGVANWNMRQAFYCGLVGLGVGLGATILTTFIAEILWGISNSIAVSFIDVPQEVPDEDFTITGVAFFILMCGRGLAWSIVSMGAGLSLGVALKSKKLLLNGLAGGMVGGMLGGLLFDPISRFVAGDMLHGELSRAVGVAAIGLLVGIFIGLFENVSKDAWFLMLRGPLTGKQFNLFKSPMVIGSAPKCDIYLFKDPAIDPRHAVVTKSGAKYVLKDEGSSSGITVNGVRTDARILQRDDVVGIGDTVLKYLETEKR